ncbi:hypothetical protein AVEN_102100-1 [Araneus ventricosus]|uniref:Uncharacterized protein n=1 Tax=Araneus ventricosus TaxID=182803 RepID=A0A4Y2V6C7_ARAVE|nr:hypothetical protein AVEN_102100-1 [Araneus ventricosus]
MNSKQDFIPTLEISQTTTPKVSPVGNRTRNKMALKALQACEPDKVVGQHTVKLQAALEKRIGLPPSSQQSGVVSSPLATYCNSTPSKIKIPEPVTNAPADDKPLATNCTTTIAKTLTQEPGTTPAEENPVPAIPPVSCAATDSMPSTPVQPPATLPAPAVIPTIVFQSSS